MTIHFPDISHWNDGVDLAGAEAVVAKATQGASYVDPTYAGFKAAAARIGAPFCAYHWLDSTDAAAQARHCYRVVGGVPLMIDDEQGVISVPHTLAFVSAYRALGGRVVLEYAPRWLWDRSGRPDLRPLAAAGLAIVSSSYPAAGYTDSGPGWTPYGGVTPTIWQYTDRRPFGGRVVDFNAYRGSREQLLALINEEDDMVDVTDIRAWTLETVNAVRRLEAKTDAALTAIGAIGTGSPEVAAVLTGLDARLATIRDEIEAEVRDAVGDLAEGGAAQVRADA